MPTDQFGDPLSARIRSFVAVGDSFTEGLEDDLGPSGRHQGWADRVAAGLAQVNGGVQYANLAIRGKVLEQVLEEQVPVAEALSPDLISFHAGLNDLLRPRVNRTAVMAEYARGVARLRATGAQVLLFTVVARTGGSGRTADVLAARFDEFTLHVRRIGEQYGCLVADLGVPAALQDRRLWHEDRLHPAPEGHARIAAAVLEQLGIHDPAVLRGAPGWWRLPLPVLPPASRFEAARADVVWIRRHLAPWLLRRLRRASSGDRIPPKYPSLIEIRRKVPDSS